MSESLSYALCAALLGHQDDVRALAPLTGGGSLAVVTGSRDKTAKLWQCSGRRQSRQLPRSGSFAFTAHRLPSRVLLRSCVLLAAENCTRRD